jgi:hypothetical protein
VIVNHSVDYGLRPAESGPPVHVTGIGEVSWRKGQVFLTVGSIWRGYTRFGSSQTKDFAALETILDALKEHDA